MTSDDKFALQDYIEFNLNHMILEIEKNCDPEYKQELWCHADKFMDDLRITFSAQVELHDLEGIFTDYNKRQP